MKKLLALCALLFTTTAFGQGVYDVERFWVYDDNVMDPSSCPTEGDIPELSRCYVQYNQYPGDQLAEYWWINDCGNGSPCWRLTRDTEGVPFSDPQSFELWFGQPGSIGSANLFTKFSPWDNVPPGCLDIYNCERSPYESPFN